jgi:hypothetical protein
MKTLLEGQKWFYESAHHRSYLIIRRIEGKHVVHITVKNVPVKGESWEISHIPINHERLLCSITSQADFGPEDGNNKEFEEGLLLWKKDNGGVWDLPLKEVITSIIQSF